MAVLRATYLDVPASQRRQAARAAKARYQALLADPTLSKAQRDNLRALIKLASKWESGSLPTKD